MSIKQFFGGGTVYRNIAFYTKGLKEFTKGGYEKAAKNFEPHDLEANISSRSYMITGSNSGLGKCAAMMLAKRGATIHMVCRTQQKAEDAKAEIIRESGNENVYLHILDLSLPRNVVKFARDFVESGQQLDVLVNNAGCMINTYEVDEDGLETNFKTNTLGTFILTTELMPALNRSSTPQVITVSSGGMYTEKLDPVDLNFESRRSNFIGMYAYGQNKRQQLVMSRWWTNQYAPVHFSTMHPGWADTPSVHEAIPEFYERNKDKFRTTEQGTDTIVWLCVAERVRQMPSGLFFLDREPASEHLALAWSKSSDEDEALLMRKLEELKARFLPESSTNLETSTNPETSTDPKTSTGTTQNVDA